MEKKDMMEESIMQMASLVFEHTPEGIMVTDTDSNILCVNPAFSYITGYSQEEVIGKKPRILHSGWYGKEFYEQMWTSIRQTGQWKGEIWNRRKNGEIYAEWLNIISIKNKDGNVLFYAGVFTDITKRKKFEDRLKQQAYYDFLTGLPNRLMFQDRLSLAICDAKRNRQLVALMFIDLDMFKSVNDTFGHDAGDRLLQCISERLKRCVRNGDTVCRLGGDEFVVVLPNLNRAQDAAKVAQKIVEQLSTPFVFGDRDIYISPSIGISIYPHDGVDFDTLLKKADVAMYMAKQSGGNAYRYYSHSQKSNISERVEFENSLYKAIKENQLVLYYQPQYQLKNGRLVGMEALLRWRHPTLGLLPPKEFIPFAETSGLIIPIGEWVLRTACRERKHWDSVIDSPFRIAVNLSARQFQQKGIAEMIENILNETGMEPNGLEIELTETTVMENAELAIKTLYQLKSLGVHMSIDDFGTGYSSLSYLSHFPVDLLKIDRSFIGELSVNRSNATIVAAIINLAHSLNLQVIAEGIENEEQLAFVKQNHCDIVQGYLLGKPRPLEEWLEAGQIQICAKI